MDEQYFKTSKGALGFVHAARTFRPDREPQSTADSVYMHACTYRALGPKCPATPYIINSLFCIEAACSIAHP